MKTLLSIKTTINNIVMKIKNILHKAAPIILGLSILSGNIQASSCIDRMLSCLHITLEGHSVVSNIVENPILDPDINAEVVARSIINNDVITSLGKDFGIDINKLIEIHSASQNIINIDTVLSFDGEILPKDVITTIWERTSSYILDKYFELLISKIQNSDDNINVHKISADLNNNFQTLSGLARHLYVRGQLLKKSEKIINSETLKKETLEALEKNILFTIEGILSPLFKTLTQLESTFIDKTSPIEGLLIRQSEILEALSERINKTMKMAASQRKKLDLVRIGIFAEKVERNIDEIIRDIQHTLRNTLQKVTSPDDINLEV